jgi:phosphatidylserine/phosphatidylglycerophosphate/cardiolipin synthase-like enzyme
MNQIESYASYRFPWRDHNEFGLLVDGDQYFDAILNDIRQAYLTVYMEMYLVESGHMTDLFIDAFLQAADNNVQVRLLLDDYGAHGLEPADRKKLEHKNIQICYYNPLHYGELRRNLFRDHRKIFVIDNMIAYTGGTGITDEFDRSSNPRYYWHEAMLRISGPCAQDWNELFCDNWNQTAEKNVIHIRGQAYTPGKQTGRVVESRSITHSEIIRSFVNRIRNAERKVWLATAYFVPSRKLQRALRKSAKKGVDVRIMLPGPHTDHPWARHMGRRYYGRLLKSGVRIYEYQPRFTHVKALLCDYWTSIGSSNVDRWNFRWNLEANQEIEDSVFARQVEQMFSDDLENCKEILPEKWAQKPWMVRLKIWFWSRVMAYLSWFSFEKSIHKKKRARRKK